MEIRVSKLEAVMDVMKTDMSLLKTDVGMLKTDVALLTTDVAIIKSNYVTKSDLYQEIGKFIKISVIFITISAKFIRN